MIIHISKTAELDSQNCDFIIFIFSLRPTTKCILNVRVCKIYYIRHETHTQRRYIHNRNDSRDDYNNIIYDLRTVRICQCPEIDTDDHNIHSFLIHYTVKLIRRRR